TGSRARRPRIARRRARGARPPPAGAGDPRRATTRAPPAASPLSRGRVRVPPGPPWLRAQRAGSRSAPAPFDTAALPPPEEGATEIANLAAHLEERNVIPFAPPQVAKLAQGDGRDQGDGLG